MTQVPKGPNERPQGSTRARWRGPVLWIWMGIVLLMLPRVAAAADGLAPPKALTLEPIPFADAPSIDGDLGEWRSEASKATLLLERSEQVHPTRRAAWDGPRDLSMRGWVGQHDNTLYMALRIQDDDRFHDPTEAWWHGDSVELFINSDYGTPSSTTGYTDGCWQLFLMPVNEEMRWGVVWRGKRMLFSDGNLRGVRMAHRLRGSEGLDIELALPLENFGIDPRRGARTIGFALALNDADTAPSRPGTYMSWNAGFDLFQRPEHFGAMTLGPTAPKQDAAAAPTHSPPSWIWSALALAFAAGLALLLAGPGSHFLARWSLRAKCTSLACIGLLALLIQLVAGSPVEAARARETQAIAEAAKAMDPIAREADHAGVFVDSSPASRADRLRRLMLGDAVPCMPPVAAARMVPIHENGSFVGDVPPRYDFDLSVARQFDLPEPVHARALKLDVRIPATDRTRRGSPTLGTLRVSSKDKRQFDVPVPMPRTEPGSASATLTLTLPQALTLHRMDWIPNDGGNRATLMRVSAQSPGNDTSKPLLLSRRMQAGIPVLAGPGTHGGVRVLTPGQSMETALPALDVPANRLWVLLESDVAFPDLLGDPVLARLAVHYDRGEPQIVALRNGIHVVASRRALGHGNPPPLASRTAYAWRDSQGFRREQPALPVGLDPTRRPVRLTLENLKPGGPLTLVAATLVAHRAEAGGAHLRVTYNDEGPHDTVHRRDAKHPDFHNILSRDGATHRDTHGDVRVHATHTFETEAGDASLEFERAIPAAATDAAARKRTLLLGCLVAALALLVLIAVDVASRFRQLTWRLGFGVIVAALVPLVISLLLVDQHARRDMEQDQRRMTAAGVDALRLRLNDTRRQIQSAAEALVEHVESHDSTSERLTLKRRVALVSRATLPSMRRASVWIHGAQIPPTVVDVGDVAQPLQCARFLHDAAGDSGLHISPWDGLLAVGSARRGSDDRWVQVIVGIPIDDDYLTSLVKESLPTRRAQAHVVAADGRQLAHADSAHAGSVDERGNKEVANQAPMFGRAASMTLPTSPSATLSPVRLALELDASDAEERLSRSRMPLLWLGLFGLVLLAGAIGLVARRIADPIRDLVDVTNAVRSGSFDVPAPEAGSDEIGQLSIAFDQMRLDLRQQVRDLARLRNAQERLSTTLDYGLRADMAATLFREHCHADHAIVLGARSPAGPIRVLAAQLDDDENRFSSEPMPLSKNSWLAHALATHGPLIRSADGDGDVAATGIEARLLRHAPAWMAVPLRAGQALEGAALLGWRDSTDATEQGGDTPRVLGLASIVSNSLHNAHLYRMAALDEQTGLQSASAFRAGLQAEVDDVLAHGDSVTVLLVGLDQSEHIARRRGSALARAVRHQCAGRLRGIVTDDMRLGAISNHDMAVRMRGINRQALDELTARIRTSLGSIEVVQEDDDVPATTSVSIGVARVPEDAASVEFAMDAAERALRAAQREGGSAVVDAGRLESAAVTMPPFEDGAVFRSRNMIDVVERARRAAASDASVLVTGETGTGKEVIASLVHKRSARASRPLVSVNCAAFPDSLLESELFGHERGAFTGAERRREGRFELADGGTLFLDEVGEMSAGAQAKLLRVLQERQFTRLGGSRPIDVDVRLIAATNADLEESIRRGTFRQDLYYRLNVIRLEIPPLRERRPEIPPLVEHFLREARNRAGRGPRGMTAGAMDVLYRHPWPGNVRELKNVVERCAVFCEGELVQSADLQIDTPMADEGAALSPRSAPTDDLNPRQRKLLEHLSRVGRCTNREYYEMTGTSPRTGLRDLQNLMERGLLVREGKRRGAVYRLP